jgi:hypothetical protein
MCVVTRPNVRGLGCIPELAFYMIGLFLLASPICTLCNSVYLG